MKKFTLLILAALFAAVSWSQQTISIGTGTSSNSGILGGLWGHQRNAVLYTANELTAEGMSGTVDITKIAFHVNTMTSVPGGTRTLKIWVKEVNNNTLTTAMFSDWATLCASADLVYDEAGTNIAITTGAWNDFIFSSPYPYQGGNLLIFTDAKGISESGGNSISTFHHSATTMHWWAYKDTGLSVPLLNDNSNCSTPGGVADANRANIRITFEETSATCPAVTALTSTNVTDNSADISWTAGGFESSWVLEYKKASEPNYASITVYSPQYFFTNLESNTQYQVRVKGICGTDDESGYRNIIFKTNCGLFAIPFIEDFTNWTAATSAFSDPCWTRYTGTGSYVSGSTVFPYVAALSSNNALYFGNSSTTFSAAFMPQFDAVGQNLALVFDLAMAANNRMDIIIATDPQDQTTWVQIDTTISNGIGTTFANYKNYEVIIPNYQAGTYIGFKSYVGSGTSVTYAYLDNIFVTLCPQPKNLAVTNVATNSINYSFTQGGVASQWQYVLAPASVTNPATIVPVTITTTSGTISGLTEATQYKLWVRSVCSATENSPWTMAVPFTTHCQAETLPFLETFDNASFASSTCWARYSLLADDLFGGTPFTTSSTAWLHTTSSNGLPGNHVRVNVFGTSRRDWLITPVIDLGTAPAQLSFDVALTAWNSGNAANMSGIDDKFIVAISTDAGNTWLESNSYLWDNAGSARVYNDIEITGEKVTIDLSAYSGLIRIGFYVESTISNADNDLHIDNILVRVPLANDVAAIDIISSVGTGLNLTSTDITVTVMNDGSVAQSNVPVVLEVNGAISATQYVATIAVAETETVTFTGVDVSTAGEYVIRAYTNLATDQNRSNDTTAVLTINHIEGCTNPLDVQIGTGTISHTILTNYNYNYVQNLYMASEIADEGGGAGPISSISLQYNTGTLNNQNNIWTVFIGNTAKTEFSGTTVADWVPVGNMQQVFNGLVTAPATAGDWITINLDSPFIWDGTSNIVVAILENEPSYPGTVTFRGTTATNRNLYFRVDGSTPINPASPPTPSGRYTSYPNIKFNMCPGIPPTCPKPTALTGILTGNDATLSWTNGGTEYEWVIEYKKVSDANWTAIIVTTNPYTISGLSASTSYNVRVKAVCSTTEESDWSNVYNFATPCGAMALPFMDDFSTWTLGTMSSPPAQNPLPPCWARYNLGYDNGRRPYADNMTSNPNSPVLYFYHSATQPAIMFMPPFDAQGQTLVLEFDLAMNTAQIFDIVVATDPQNISTYTTIVSLNDGIGGTSIITGTAAFKHYEVTIPNYQTSTVIGFYARGAGNLYAYLDNIVVDIATGCSRPTALAVDNITTSDAEITWTAGGSETSWILEYKKGGETNWISIPTSTSFYFLSGLDDNTGYNVRVKADCGTEESSWATVNFRTDFGGCNAVSVPFSENFSGWATGTGNWSNPCWTRYVGNAASTVPYINAANYSSATNNSPSGTPYLYIPTTTDLVVTVVLPEFAVDVNTLQINFWALKEGTSSGTISVGYLTDINDVTSFVEVEQFNDPGATWFEYTVALNTVPSGINSIALRQNKLATNWFYWFDDIVVETLPTCVPAAVTVGTVADLTATISWEGGSATNYVVEWGETGFAQGTGTTQTVTGETYTITGLEPLTSYDVYVYGDCGAGDLSKVRKVSFTTTYLSTIIVTPENPYLEDLENAVISGANVIMGNVRWNIANDFGNSMALSIRNDDKSIDGNYAYISKGVNGHVASLTSPMFDITALDIPAFSLQHIQWGYYTVTNRSEELRVYYRAAQEDNWTLIPGMEFTSIINDWEIDTVVLPNPSATYQLRFEVTGRDAMGVGIDNVRIFEGAPMVETLEASNVMANSAVLNKNVEKGIKPITEEGWEYKTASATTWQTTTNATITGLTHSTAYEFRAFATTADRIYYGEILTFNTQISSIETVFESSNVTLYPNPAKAITTLAIEGLTSAAQVVITDLTGRTIGSYTLSATQNQLNIDVSGFADGTYLVRVITDKGSAIQKLVVKK